MGLLISRPSSAMTWVKIYTRSFEASPCRLALLENRTNDFAGAVIAMKPARRLLLMNPPRNYIDCWNDSPISRFSGAYPKPVSSPSGTNARTTTRWRGLSFPPQLFSNLEKRCPAPSFYYEGGLSQVIYHDLLMGAPYLRSLSITSRLEMMADRQIDINDLGALILTLPNLERLILKHYPGGPFRFQAISRPIFDLPPGSSLPPLQIISFANFSFTSQQAADWAKCLAQRDVRSLSLDGPAGTMSTFIDCISCSIRTLNSVKIRVSDGTDPKISPHLNDSLDGLLRQNPALTSFAAYDLSTDALRSVIRYHGGHLRCLQFRRTRNGRSPGFGFRNVDAGRYYSPTAVYWDDECLFSPDDLRDLAYQLPAVERLGIDLSFRYKMASSPQRKTVTGLN